MIYKSGEPITFVAFYTASGQAKTGLTITANVHRIGYGIVDNPTVYESSDGNGIYYCTYTPNYDGAYVCIFKTTDSSVDQKHLAGIAFRGVANVNNLPTASEINDTLTSSHGTGSWQAANIEPMLLRISEDEISALLDRQSRKPISLFRGDSLSAEISVVDADGNAVDLTDASAKFTARERENDSSAVIEKALEIYDPSNGKMRLTLTSTDTNITPKSYPADIEITFADGRVKTIWKAYIEVKWDVSR
ncbi:BppU family phage baseplate upper protein [bacterium]|nr:BppU family phage baseplate upper protein [bacterium]